MRYYIISGENSGDMHAANLVSELKNIDNCASFRAWGGDKLLLEKVSLAKHIKETSFMGIWSVFKNLPKIYQNLKFCKKDIINFNPNAIILVDYPGFNLKIAEFAKKNSFKVFYYISPKLWAWNKSRITTIKKYVDHLLVIFPFEVEFYKRHNLDVLYVGNPLLDEIKKKQFNFSIVSKKPIFALLPGSRKQEINAILPNMLSIVDSFPHYQFIIAGTKLFTDKYYNSLIKDSNVILIKDETYGLLDNAKFALVTSGTATLEAALFKVPQIVCYKTSWLTYFIAKMVVKIKHISLVNIILEKLAVQELIQSKLNNNNLISETKKMMNNKQDMLNDYNDLINMLDKNGASKNTGKFIFNSI